MTKKELITKWQKEILSVDYEKNHSRAISFTKDEYYDLMLDKIALFIEDLKQLNEVKSREREVLIDFMEWLEINNAILFTQETRNYVDGVLKSIKTEGIEP